MQVACGVLDKGGIGRLIAQIRARQQVYFGEVEVQTERADIVLGNSNEFGFDLNLAGLHVQDAQDFLQVENLLRIIVAQYEGVIGIQGENILWRNALQEACCRALTGGRLTGSALTASLRRAAEALSTSRNPAHPRTVPVHD